MNFQFDEAIEILTKTPVTLEMFLVGLSDGWLECDEGDQTWNTKEVIEHLIDCEKDNWIPRLKTILQNEKEILFPPFNRFSHLERSERTIKESIQEFKSLRSENIKILSKLVNPTTQLEMTGHHPEFGQVKLRELLSTWVVHDFTHITQIMRVMAKRYKEDVGPWKAYLSVLK